MTDHIAEANSILNARYHGSLDCPPNEVARAHALATVALAEQARIANLLAYWALAGNALSAPDAIKIQVQERITEGLGLQ